MRVFKRPEAEIHDEVHGSEPGSDVPRPAETSAGIVRLAPAHLEVHKDWRGPTHLAGSIRRVTDFLTRHTP